MGFVEFNSHLYMRFTFFSLLNLYDYSEDLLIKELARDCLYRFIRDWMTVTNTIGTSSVVAGRTYSSFFYLGERISRFLHTFEFSRYALV